MRSIIFFFQAEDGIRDFHVTGVQTCALPISSCRAYRAYSNRFGRIGSSGRRRAASPAALLGSHMTTSPPLTSASILRARTAVASVFILSGLAIASWFARIPQVRDELELTAGQLGQVLLVGAFGAVAARPLAGLVVGRFGTARAVAGAGLMASGGLALVAAGAGPLGSAAITAIGLTALGYGMGTWDVAMNVEGAAV